MSTNQFIPVEYRIGSCLFGNRSYRVISDESSFCEMLLEEILDSNRQSPGSSYMTVRSDSRQMLVMVPFDALKPQLIAFLSAMDQVMACHMGTPGFVFPQDVTVSENRYAYLFSEENLGLGMPLRTLMPAVRGPRWDASISIFRRVQQLREMRLTSNGFSREQLRYDPDTGEVRLWLNHTMSLIQDSWHPERVLTHRGFLALPSETEKQCFNADIRVEGFHRDIFSAAVAAFYMLTCGHPFVGQSFNHMDRESYLAFYHSKPSYVMEPGSANALANSELHEVTKERLAQTVPQLRALFDEIFLATTHPEEFWQAKLSCWDPEQWIRALELDKQKNDHETSQPAPQFDRWVYHLV